jgi:hypothetical protein
MDVPVIQATIHIVASAQIRGEALDVLRCLKEPRSKKGVAVVGYFRTLTTGMP